MSETFRPYKSFPTQKYFKTLPEKEWFGEPNGIATLDENGKLDPNQIPSGVGGDEHNKGWFATPDALPSTGIDGDYAIVGSTNTVWAWDGDTSTWVNSGSSGQVESVNGKTGAVVLKAGDIAINAISGVASNNTQDALAEIANEVDGKQSKLDYYGESAGIAQISGTGLNEINISATEVNIDGTTVKVNGNSIVNSVNSKTPDENGNIALVTSDIPNLSIGSDNRTITIGDKTVVLLTADSSIAANKISGTVASAIKASQDEAGNVISTTYAKTTDTSLTTTDKTLVGAINEINAKTGGSSSSSSSTTQTTTSITSTDTPTLLHLNGDSTVLDLDTDAITDYTITIIMFSTDGTSILKKRLNFIANTIDSGNIIISSTSITDVTTLNSNIFNAIIDIEQVDVEPKIIISLKSQVACIVSTKITKSTITI